jgi:uncharacterized membrane protein YeaQ/YmgE (transglycosylase-associated protein family)
MGIIEFILLLIIAAVCGSVGMALTGFNNKGCLVSTAVGFIGAIIGTWIARRLGLPEIFNIKLGGAQFPIIWSIIGAVVFSLPLSLLFGRRR